MKLLPNDIYKKIKELDIDVKEKLKRQGIVVPVQERDGSIRVGFYKIVKHDGVYSIVDFGNESIIDSINLPQSAALLANKLALGKGVEDNILIADRKYGHALFEETLQTNLAVKHIKKNKLDDADLMYTKAKISKQKKERYRDEIARGFEKLIRFR